MCDDGQGRISHAEVMTVPVAAALFHRSNHALTRRALFEQGYIKINLSASRFCRRLRAIPEAAWQMVCGVADGVRRGRWCAAWQMVCGVADGVRRGRWCAAWQMVCGVADGVRRGRWCAAWQMVCGVADGVRRGRWCAAWQMVCGVADGVRRGRWCAAWQMVCGVADGVRRGRWCAAWQMVFGLLSQVFVAGNTSGDYAVDSMPVLVCQNVRINRCHLFPPQHHEALRGYQSSKKRYFWGFKVHLLVTRQGEPVEFFISEGSLHDLEGLRRLPLDLPAKSTIYGDTAYFDLKEEELVRRAGRLRLVALRRKNARVPLPRNWWLCAIPCASRSKVPSALSARPSRTNSMLWPRKDSSSKSKPSLSLTPLPVSSNR